MVDVVDKAIAEKHRHYDVVEWVLDSKLVDGDINDLNSDAFYFLKGKLYLSMGLEDNGWWSLQLIRKDSYFLSVCFKLSLKATGSELMLNSKIATHCFSRSNSMFFWPRVVRIDELARNWNKLYPNGISVFCELSLNDDPRADAPSQSLPQDNSAVNLAQNLSDLYLKQQLCDVTINVGGRKFEAHRSILAARSTVFAAMFQQDTKEKKSGVIKIDGCDPDAFHDFLLYLYSAKVDIISTKNVIALHFIADKYGLSQLTWWCEQFLSTNLSVELFCDALVLAMKYRKPIIIKAAEDFFAKHIEKILVTVKWQCFMKENNIVANALFIKCARRFKSR